MLLYNVFIYFSHSFLFWSFKWQYPSEEDMIEWAKRESEREEEQRLARLNQQEQEDLELAIALSKSEISEAWGVICQQHSALPYAEAIYHVHPTT